MPTDAALAHPAFEGASGFYGGLLHPLLVPAHALTITVTGLLGARQAPRWQVPACYATGLAVGFAAMMAAYAPQSAGEVLLAAAGLSGVLVAIARPLPHPLSCALALTTGASLALDSPPGGISVAEANLTVLGTFCGAIILLLAVLELTKLLSRDWQWLAVRILGSWIAASAVLALSLRFAR
jgi:urease accessory protein